MADRKFTIQELKAKVKQAIGDFMKEHPSLLKLPAHEQAISHRVAFYLENVFCECDRAGLNVDCEYNKHLDDSKRVNIDGTEYPKEEYENCGCAACRKLQKKKSLPNKLFRPDVVVHSRGNDDRNQIAIEIKTNKICPFDKAKLEALTKLKANGGKYEYQLGVFLYFPHKKPKFQWFAHCPNPPSASIIVCQTEA